MKIYYALEMGDAQNRHKQMYESDHYEDVGHRDKHKEIDVLV